MENILTLELPEKLSIRASVWGVDGGQKKRKILAKLITKVTMFLPISSEFQKKKINTTRKLQAESGSEESLQTLRSKVAALESDLEEQKDTHENTMQATIAKAKEKIRTTKEALQAAQEEADGSARTVVTLNEVC